VLLDNVYKKILTDYETQRDFCVRPSNVGSCALSLRKQLIGEKKEISAKILFAFSVGSALHEMLVSKIWRARGEEANYIYLVSEKELDTAIGKGRADLLIRNKENGETIVVDFKIISDAHFRKIKQHGLESVGIRYMIQLALYCDAVKTKKGLFVFVNKDNGEFLEISVCFDLLKIENYIQLARKIKDAVENNDIEAIKRFSPAEAWECGYCSFKDNCELKKVKRNDENKMKIEVNEEELAEIQRQIEKLNEEKEELESRKKEILENVSENFDGELLKILVMKTERTDYDKDELLRYVDHNLLEKIVRRKEIITKRVILK